MKTKIILILFLSFLQNCNKEEHKPIQKKITFDSMELKCGVLPTGTYNSIFFVSNEKGFTCNNNGEIYYTQDGGSTWKPQISGTSKQLINVFFLDHLNGFIVGGGNQEGVILKTIDGGVNWASTAIAVQDVFNAVHFINSSTGFIVGKGILLKTINSGETWNKINLDKPYNLEDISFFDENVGLSSGSSTIRTIDGGNNWIETNTTSGHIQILNDRVAFLYQFGSKILKTSDRGITWSEIKFDYGAMAVHFINEQQAIAAGQQWPSSGFYPNGAIYISNDGGQIWDLKLTKTSECFVFNAISFPNDSIGYAVGNTGEGCIAKFNFNQEI
jgi:photosystem II stability/assembly factor-like uncharacterized protein